MIDIKGRLGDISKEIANLKNEADAAKKELQQVSNTLQFDPTNVDAIRQKFSLLRSQLDTNRKSLEQYEARLSRLREYQEEYRDDEASLKRIGKEIETTERKIVSLTNSIDYLNKQTDEMREKTELASAAQSRMNKQMEQYEQVAQKAAKIALAVVVAYAALVNKTVESGNEIYATAQKYDTTAESLQRYNKQLEIATGEQNVYSESLRTMSRGMADIASGRGIAYEQALRNIGISTKEWMQLSRAEQYRAIFNGLRNVTDATQRAAAAQKLLGDSGLYVSQAASLSAEEWAKVNSESKKFAILTDDQVNSLHNLNVQIEILKAQFGATFADLVIASAPLIEAFIDFLRDVAIPVLRTIGNVLSTGIGRFVTGALVTMLIALPKIIALIKAIKLLNIAKGISTTAAAFAGLNVVTAKWQIILLAVSAVILGIIALIAKLKGSANEAQGSLDKMTSSYDSLSGAGVDIKNSAENYTSYQSEKTVNIGVEISGKGDTALSDAAASQVAMLTAEEVNKSLGELIK